jgi:hypothetical protein
LDGIHVIGFLKWSGNLTGNKKYGEKGSGLNERRQIQAR